MNYFKTTILLAVLTAILVFFGASLGGKNGAIAALVFAAVMNFGMYWFSDRIVLAMYGAKEADEAISPRLFRIVRGLAQKASLPMPRVYIMENDAPNAFATGRNPEHAVVAATTGIIELLTPDELSGVIAHELAHIKHRDMLISTIAATIAGAISYLSHMAYYASLFTGGGNRDDDRGGGGIELLVMAIVAPIAAMIIQLAISRSREYGADEGGARIEGSPMHLANALRKLDFYNKKIPMEGATPATSHMFIVSPLSGGGFVKLFSTHPPIEDRIQRLEAMVGKM